MSRPGDPLFLRRILLVDAVVSGVTGLAMVVGAGTLGGVLGVPSALLRYAGLSLFPFAAIVASLASREVPPRSGVLAVVGLNVAWAAASVMLLLPGGIHPNGLGYAFILGQAAVVAALAEMQYVGIRRSSRLAA